MNVHFSIDDVILPFKTITSENPDSVFHIPFFYELQEWYRKYNIRVTLYCYYKFEKDGFTIDRVPEKYWYELISAGYIKVGFHGCFYESDNSDNKIFCSQCDMFYRTVPSELCSYVLRLDRYSADTERVEFLKKYNINQLLCRDNKSQKTLNALPSYNLNENEMNVLDLDTLIKNDVKYRKTNALIELYTNEEFREYFRALACDPSKDTAVFFTHSKIIYQNSQLISKALDVLSEYNVNYIF